MTAAPAVTIDIPEATPWEAVKLANRLTTLMHGPWRFVMPAFYGLLWRCAMGRAKLVALGRVTLNGKPAPVTITAGDLENG